MSDDFITPLAIGISTQITEEHISSIIKEAYTWPDGSRERLALIGYAKSLRSRLDKQNEMDK